MGKGKIKDQILKILRDVNGYNVEYNILDSSDFNVPQTRKRVILIGHKKVDAKYLLPKKAKTNVITVKDAISDLPEIESGANEPILQYPERKNISNYAQCLRKSSELNIESRMVLNHITTKNSPLVLNRYKHIPQGGNWRNIPDRLMKNYCNKNRCHSSVYLRLREDMPSVTLSNIRKNMFIHPTQDRGLSVREAARLQSFPDWYEFTGSINSQQQQVADAVPPNLARAIARQIKKMED